MLLLLPNILLGGSGPSPGRPPAGPTRGRRWPGFCLREHFAAPDWMTGGKSSQRGGGQGGGRRRTLGPLHGPASRAWTAETATPASSGASPWALPPDRTTARLGDNSLVEVIHRWS